MKALLKFFLFVIFICALNLTAAWIYRDFLIEVVAEKYVNQTQQVFFGQTFEVEGVHLGKDLILKIDRVKALWKMPESTFPFEIENITFRQPVSNFLSKKPISMTFERFAPQGSKYPGVTGTATLENDVAGTFALDAQFVGVDLGELIPLDPVNLKGSSGKLIGDFSLKSNLSGQQSFKMDLKVEKPGGKLQARFFDILKPYLPAADKVVLEKIAGLKTVNYTEAKLQIALPEPEKIKLTLRIFVPDYNLKLNLNMELRVETQEAFFQLAELMGLMKVQT